MDDLAPKLKDCLRQHLMLSPTDDIDLSTELGMLGLDSMRGIALLLEIENAFAIKFPDAMLGPSTFRSGATLLAAIAKLRAGQAG